MRQLLATVVLGLAFVLVGGSAVDAHNQAYLNSHCAAEGSHLEDRETIIFGAELGIAKASLTFGNTGDPYAQCGFIRVRMYYKYKADGEVRIAYLQDTAYPGNYPYDSSDDLTARVSTGWHPQVLGCNHVDYTINVGGPGGPTSTWSHLC